MSKNLVARRFSVAFGIVSMTLIGHQISFGEDAPPPRLAPVVRQTLPFSHGSDGRIPLSAKELESVERPCQQPHDGIRPSVQSRKAPVRKSAAEDGSLSASMAPISPTSACNPTVTLTSAVTYSGSIAPGTSNMPLPAATLYGCGAYAQDGPEVVHLITLPLAAPRLVIDLSFPIYNASSQLEDLDLFVLGPVTCDSAAPNCLGASEQDATVQCSGSEKIVINNPVAGNYYVVVENYYNVAATYNLTATIHTTYAGGFAPVTSGSSGTIGTTLPTANTTGNPETLDRYFSTKLSRSIGWDESGPEIVYSYTVSANPSGLAAIPTGPNDLRATLDYDPKLVDVDVFIVDGSSGILTSDKVVAYGDTTAVATNVTIGTTYYIVVDTYAGGTAPNPNGGEFRLTLSDARGVQVIDGDTSGTLSPLCRDSSVTVPLVVGGLDVWNGTAPANYLNPLTAILGAGNFTNPPWDLATAGCIPQRQLLNSRRAVWFTGGASIPGLVLPQSMQDLLSLYMSNGGRLWLEGQDILFGVTNNLDGYLRDRTFLNDWLQVTSFNNDIDKAGPNTVACPTASGVAGVFTLSGSIYDNTGAVVSSWGTEAAPQLVFSSALRNGTVCIGAPANFSISNLPAGTYTLSLTNPNCINSGFQPVSQVVTITSASVSGLKFYWKPGKRVRGAIGNVMGCDSSTPCVTTNLDLSNKPTGYTCIPGAALYNPYTDALVSRYAEPVFYAGNDQPAGIMYDSSAGSPQNGNRSILLAFSPENDTTTTTNLQTVLSRGLGWLGSTDGCNDGHLSVSAGYFNNTDTTPSCTPYCIARPGDSVTFRVYAYDCAKTSTWAASRVYAAGEMVRTTHANANNHVYTVSVAGTSGATEPIWPTGIGAIIVNGTVTFKEANLGVYYTSRDPYLTLTTPSYQSFGPVPAPYFLASHAYAVGEYVQPYASAYTGAVYRVTIAGTSGVEPATWPALYSGTTIASGTVTFKEADDAVNRDFTFTVGAGTPVGYRALPDFAVHQSGTYCTSQAFGLFVGQPQILLVKDELRAPNTTGLDVYQTILGNLGYSAGVWDTAQFYPPLYNDVNAISNDIMINYHYVIWFTGYDFRDTLTPSPSEGAAGIDPQTELSLFLNRTTPWPGSLVISSQDYLWDKYAKTGCTVSCAIPPADFAYNYLKLASVEQDLVKDTETNVNGSLGTWATEYSVNTLSNDPTSPTTVFSNAADSTVVRSGIPEAKTWGNFVSGKPAGVAYMEKNLTSGKVVFMPFAFENLVENPPDYTKQAILQRILCQMSMLSSCTNPGCGYNVPGPFGLTPDVRGVKTAGVDGKFTWGDVVKQTCTAGRLVYGKYRLRRGTVASSLSYVAPSIAPPPSYTTPVGDRGLAIVYYDVDSYEDDFGVIDVTTCPAGPPTCP